MKKLLLIMLLTVGLLGVACSEDIIPTTPEQEEQTPNEEEQNPNEEEPETEPQPEPEPTPKPDPEPELPNVTSGRFDLSSAERGASQGINDFSLNLFRAACAQESKDKNLAISPLSISVLMSMIANGASDKLAGEIYSAMGCDDIDALNSLCYKYLQILPKADKAVTVNLPNAVWYSSALTLAPAYSSAMTTFYGADIYQADMPARSTMDAINGWVSDKTGGLIPTILSQPLDPVINALVANALYFNGLFADPFDEALTTQADFHGTSGNTKVQMMHRDGTQYFTITDDYSTAMLNFGDGKFYSYFILPSEGADIDSFIASKAFDKAVGERSGCGALDCYLPKFKLRPEQDLILNNILGSVGIRSLGGDISSMFTTPVTVDHGIRHKATFEVTEKGAEGSAVSWDSMAGMTPDYKPEKARIVFDRPFVVVVSERETGAMLFAAKVVNL